MIKATMTFTDFNRPIAYSELEDVVDESWSAELTNLAQDLAMENGVVILDFTTSVGVWQGQLEPSISAEVEALSWSDLRDMAADLAAEYDQDAVMVTERHPADNGEVNGIEVTVPIDLFGTGHVLQSMRDNGIDGGRLEGNTLIMFSDDRDELTRIMTMGNEWSISRAAPARAEFVPAAV